jgi:chromosome partitioning protein
MVKIIVYANQKGGVTKTTTASTFALMATLTGKRAVLVDMDPQGNSTTYLGYNPDFLDHTVYTGMRGKSTLPQILRRTFIHTQSGSFFDPADTSLRESLGITHSLEDVINGPDLLPNNILGSGADLELQEEPAWGFLLKNLLARLRQYDEIHIDTNPSLGRLTVNALLAATDVVIPMVPEVLPQKGMIALIRSIERAKENNPQLNLAGILFTRVRYASHRQIMGSLREQGIPQINEQFPRMKISCFQNHINEAAAFGEAALRQSSILFTENGPISAQYWAVYIELLDKIGGPGLEMARQTYDRLQTQMKAAAK